MTDRIEYVDDNGDHITTVESSVVPHANDYVVIDGERWRIFARDHTVFESGQTTTLHVWKPDAGFEERDIEAVIRKTLESQWKAARAEDQRP